MDIASPQESLAYWSKRNGIYLGDEEPTIIGYWCRYSGVSLKAECVRRGYTANQFDKARAGWREAEAEMLNDAEL